MTNPFDILGIQPDAEPEVVEAAYRALMKKYHPDRAGPNGLEKAKALTLAYTTLKDRASQHSVRTPNAAPEMRSTSTRDAIPAEAHADYMPTPPLRMGIRLGFAMLALFGIPLLGAAILKLAGG